MAQQHETMHQAAYSTRLLAMDFLKKKIKIGDHPPTSTVSFPASSLLIFFVRQNFFQPAFLSIPSSLAIPSVCTFCEDARASNIPSGLPVHICPALIASKRSKFLQFQET